LFAISAVLVGYFACTAAGLTNAPVHNSHGAEHVAQALPDYFAVTPFVVLLAAIAVLPLMKRTEHWWESNLHRFYVAAALVSVTLAYYLFVYADGGWSMVGHVLNHAILQEYIPFIVLLFSLYVISGGIRIEGDLVARPMTNTMFLVVGGLLASFIGTTGAAMVLIRPLLETNRQRKHVQHTVIFFIFIVCNCGGCLLPIGDPPLFLGYLEGVEFFWTMKSLLLPWALVNAVLIATYYVWDRAWSYPKEIRSDIECDSREKRPIRVKGLWPNALLLASVVISVALLDPNKSIPGTDWHPWLYLRETVLLGLIFLSLVMGSESIRRANKFNYHAILEVAVLFVGIFICMQPALAILGVKGPDLGVNTPTKFFWMTGGLSAVLDNAPTYVVFFRTADAQFQDAHFAELVSAGSADGVRAAAMLVAISLGAVFMGAMTYIGNGPNFMVKSIAEQSGVRMPSFFGYVFKYSLPVLVPILLLTTLLFFI
jgi:Na+/H+ antiporter NhaD/arsenite permease-like protein